MELEQLWQVLQSSALVLLAIDNIQLKRRFTKLEKKLTEIRVDIISESIRKTLKPVLQTWETYKETDKHGQKEQ